jgi:4-aminobutyrate aminotransferase
MKVDTQVWQNSSWMERRAAALPRGVSQAHPLFVAHANNAELWDVEGRRYIDFCGGIAVVNTGHCRAEVIAAAAQQMQRFTHTCFQVVAYDSYVALAERLNALAPGSAPKKTFFMSTGAEAYTKRSGIVAFSEGFHGRTLMALALTGKIDPYKAGFGPFPAEIFHAPYPCELHGVSTEAALAGIEKLFKVDIEPQRVAAIVIEPVAGEGGYYVAPFDFMRRLRELCDRHGILLIADEIQTGIGRTGTMFAVEHSNVVPDVMVLAKGLGGGFPISAVVGRADVMDATPPGGLGGTYAGNPLGCAAGLAVLDVIEREKLLARSARLGERLTTHLRSLAKRYPIIGDVRGLGMMVAMELFADSASRTPATELTKALVAEARKRGLLLLSCGAYGNVIRLMAPLTVSEAIIDEAMTIFGDAISALTRAH